MFKFITIPKRQWNNKKIALVSILVATSIVFVVIFNRIFAIATIPSFKIAIAGLPIKLSGYIFGPLVGIITGVISDLLSFAIFPTIFHAYYTLAFAFAGYIPGIFGYLMHRRWKLKGPHNPDDDYKYNDTNFWITIATILFSMVVISYFVLSPLANFEKSIIKNRWVFFGIVISGSATMLVATILFRAFLKPKLFNALLPIIAFSVILDLVNTPLVSAGDQATIVEDNFLIALTGHILLTPLKSWGNMIIIYWSYKIVAPLIFNKTSNSWLAPDSNLELPQSKAKKVESINKKIKGTKL